jgi:outer membrane protein OmpA-like peptidoglycan-associated protein/flagellar hook assembly protein FlgD
MSTDRHSFSLAWNTSRTGRIRLLVVVPLLLMATLAGGLPNSGDLLSLYAPAVLAGGRHLTLTGVPSAHVLNPALSATDERLNFELGYIALLSTAGDGGLGHAATAGATVPTRIGTWGFSGHFFGSEVSQMTYGPLGALHVSFAKELYRGLFVGAGAGVQLGNDHTTEEFAFGAGLDLGLLHRAGDLGPLQDLSWGLAFRGIGLGFAEQKDEYQVYVPPFTLAAGLAVSPLASEDVALTTKVDLWSPTLQAVKLELGLALEIRDFLQLRANYPVTVFGDGDEEGLEVGKNGPGFGVSVSIGFGEPALEPQDERSGTPGEVKVHVAAAPIRDELWGVGLGAGIAVGNVDTAPPEVFIDSAEVEYRSPNLDGIQDDLELPIRITDGGLVEGFVLVIEDEAGNVVRMIRNKEWQAESTGVPDAFERLFTVKAGIEVPASLVWDGRSSGGNVVADGSYQYYLEAWDDRGNHAQTARRTVVVDNTPPQASAQAVDLLFSPNGDGNKDTLTIEQQLSSEERWQAQLLDASDAPVTSFEWEGEAPATVEWDGRRDDGTMASDGVYGYHVFSTDRAGNFAEARVSGIVINTQSTPIAVRITDADISPNGDGEDDSTSYLLEVPVLVGVERWELAIRNAARAVVRRYTGGARIPDEIAFDGRDDAGRSLPEGVYRARLDVVYENGNRPFAEPPELVIDLTGPSATIKAELTVFSPNGDGNKDTVTVFHESYDEAVWTATVRDTAGAVIRTQIWHGTPDDSYTWDGRRADGRPVPDGTYRYTLAARDSAGNEGRSNSIDLQVDTADTPVFITTSATHFSPNSDGVADHVVLLPRLEDKEGIDRYTLQIHAGRGAPATARVVRTLSGRDRVPEQIIWDGIDDAGDRVADGSYFGSLQVSYAKGNNPSASSPPFVVDTKYPEAELAADSLVLSPDGDGRRDEMHVQQSSSREERWEGEISDGAGTVVRSFFWRGELADFIWDARDENGNVVRDGQYTYRVTGRDRAGNTATAVLEGIEVDGRPTSLAATLATEGFSPNGDDVRDTQAIGVEVGVNEGIRVWELKFVHARQGSQRAMGGTGAVPERVVWDGLDNQGTPAPEGAYVAEVHVDYLKGNQPRARTETFMLDRTPPRVRLALSPLPFSPDGDGVDDVLTMAVEVEDLSPISGWSMTITDHLGAPFTTLSGRGAPGERITWDGLSDSGELVQSALEYPVALAVSDIVGNVSFLDATIPIDILIIRDGDKLRIRIAAITFPPDSADLALVTGEPAARNARTITRLGEIFNKNSAYTILIEGHANSVLYANPEAAAREQRDVLLPLSAARAAAVQRELVALGVSADRITTDGVGGANPVVPFSDQQNRWKNRRVEFILTSRGS